MAEPELSDATVRQALESEVIPPPRTEARRQAIALAMSAFDEETQKSSQGSGYLFRPISIVLQYIRNFMGDWHMNTRTLGLVTSATVGVALLATLFPTDFLTRHQPFGPSSLIESVAPLVSSDKAGQPVGRGDSVLAFG